jgi:DnaJ-class molecular chaperone
MSGIVDDCWAFGPRGLQEQKQKQRHKEYERKRDAKARDRQLYHMRHTRDYEALELPIGASRADVKAAYRRLAKLWHPDKHPDKVDEAKEKFQNIQRAYDSLMLTEEDARIEAIAG